MKPRIAWKVAGLLALALFFEVTPAPTPVGATPVASCTPAPSGLIGWWRGENNVIDAMSGPTGTFNGALPPAHFAAGKVGQAFQFDGVDDYVSIPNNGQFSHTAFHTADAGIYWDDNANGGVDVFQAIFGKFADGAGDSYSMFIRETDGSLYNSMTISGTPVVFETVAGVVTQDAWTHVAHTFDGDAGTFKVYVNGVEVALNNPPAITTGTFLNANSGPLTISTRAGVQHFFNGLIDEVEVFNRTLAQSEIQAIHNAGPLGKCIEQCATAPSSMVAWYSGDGHAADIDIVGDKHGIAKNDATYTAGPNDKVARSFSFDGTDDYFEMPDDAEWNLTNFTMDTWVKFDSVGEADFPQTLIAHDDGAGNNRWLLQKQSQFSLNFISGDITTGAFFDTAAGVWYHIAITRAGDDVTFYLNGISLGSLSIAGALPDAAAPLTLGRSFAGEYLDGALDEVEIISTALTGQQVLDIYLAGSAGKCTGTVQVQKSGGAGGAFDLVIDNYVHLADATNGQITPKVRVFPDAHQVGEVPVPGWTGSMVCRDEGGTGIPPVFDGPAHTVNILVNVGDDIVCVVTNVAASCYSAPGGLIDWWTGDSHAASVGGFFNHGVAGADIAYAAAIVDKGFSLPGNPDSNLADDGVVAGDPGDGSLDFDETESFTIDAWFQSDDLVNLRVILAKRPDGGAGYQLTTFGGQLSAGVDDGSLATFVSAPLSGTGFHHAAMVLDRASDTLTVYLDGAPVETLGAGIGSFANGVPFAIGTDGFDPAHTWDGIIDEIEVFNRALSATEIENLYLAGAAGKCTGLIQLKKDVIGDRANLFNLAIDSFTHIANVGDGGQSNKNRVQPGTHEVAESIYNEMVSSVACFNGVTQVANDDGTHVDVTVSEGADIICTFTNQKTSIEVVKALVGGSDTFDLDIDGVTPPSGEDKGDGGTTNEVVVTPNVDHTVSETFGNEAPVTGYVTQITCRKDNGSGTGQVVASGIGTSLQVFVPLGSDIICMIANINTSASCPGSYANTIFGTNGNDTLTGTPNADLIVAFAGNDTVNGGNGDDCILGMEGRDTLNGGQGNDRIFGGDGIDTIDGGIGNDFLDGGNNDDTINGGNGDDEIHGRSGLDQLKGGNDSDHVYGGAGADQVEGNTGNDFLFGDSNGDANDNDGAADTIMGGAGSDQCVSSAPGTEASCETNPP